MGPRQLQQLIHSESSSSLAVWSGYKGQIDALWSGASRKDDYNDHLLREFGRKINDFGYLSTLGFEEVDAGFRVVSYGPYITGAEAPTGESPTYIYQLSSAQPAWSGMRFYDPSATNLAGDTLYYDETDTYALWNAGPSHYIAPITQVDVSPPVPRFFRNIFDDILTGLYVGTAGYSGSVTVLAI